MYTVNLKEKAFEAFMPDISVDDYVDATKADANPEMLQKILDKIIGLKLNCKIFIYNGETKQTLTVHPLGNSRK